MDLTGSRDFLTADATEQLLAALLAPGSGVSTVCARVRVCVRVIGRGLAVHVENGVTKLQVWSADVQ